MRAPRLASPEAPLRQWTRPTEDIPARAARLATCRTSPTDLGSHNVLLAAEDQEVHDDGAREPTEGISMRAAMMEPLARGRGRRRSHWALATALVVLVALAVASSPTTRTSARSSQVTVTNPPPNVVVILTDDLRVEQRNDAWWARNRNDQTAASGEPGSHGHHRGGTPRHWHRMPFLRGRRDHRSPSVSPDCALRPRRSGMEVGHDWPTPPR